MNRRDLQSLFGCCFFCVGVVVCCFFVLFFCFKRCWSHKVYLLYPVLDTKVRERSHSCDKSQVCNFNLQLIQSCQLKLFSLAHLLVFMINLTIRICVKIHKHPEILCNWLCWESRYIHWSRQRNS